MNIETLHIPELACGEGPYYHTDTNTLYLVDAAGKGVYAYHNSSKSTTVLAADIAVTSLVYNHDNALIISTLQGLFLYKNDRIIPVQTSMPLHNLNEMVADIHGNIWAAQISYSEDGPASKGGLYKIAPNGFVTQFDDDLQIGNGMDFNPTNTTFYMAETAERCIYSYRFNATQCSISHKQVFAHIPDDAGLPDGLVVDGLGNVWVACFFGSALLVYNSKGTQIDKIILPVEQPTSICFGIDGYAYVTTAALHWPTKLFSKSFELKGPKGGCTYKLPIQTKARVKYQSALKINEHTKNQIYA